jgi:hypothetical protein
MLETKLGEALRREAVLEMKLGAALQREAELTRRLDDFLALSVGHDVVQSAIVESALSVVPAASMPIMISTAPDPDDFQLTIYREFEPSLLQAIERIQMDEGFHRQQDFLQIENSVASGILPPSTGGVYFAWSDCLGCMKIGATRRESPQPRLREISRYTTTPFKLSGWLQSASPFRLELAAHRFFKDKRINTRGSGAGTEFFDITVEEAAMWVAEQYGRPVQPTVEKKKKRKDTESDTLNPKKQKQNTGQSNDSHLRHVSEFVEKHIVFRDGYKVTTKFIQDKFFEKYHLDVEMVSEKTFQRTLKNCIGSKFPDQSTVFASRSMLHSERCRGYIGICLLDEM